MPPAIIIPVAAMVATAAFSAINQNVQNKAANKNNLNQQAGNIAYDQSLRQKAMNWVKQNPSPTTGMQVRDQTLRPNGTAPPAPPANATAAFATPQSMAPAAPNAFGAPRANLGPGGVPGGPETAGSPGVAALVAQILKSRQGGAMPATAPGLSL
jgi:hypothetical protein